MGNPVEIREWNLQGLPTDVSDQVAGAGCEAVQSLLLTVGR